MPSRNARQSVRTPVRHKNRGIAKSQVLSRKSTSFSTLKPKNLMQVLEIAPNLVVYANPREQTISILPPGAIDHFLVIDGIAAELWTMLDGKNSIKDITLRLSEKHQLTPKVVAREIQIFLKDLIKFRLVKNEST